jgi:hypothetical protein
MNQCLGHLLTQIQNSCVGGIYPAKPHVQGLGVQHRRLDAVRNVMKHGAIAGGYGSQGIELHARREHDVPVGINASGAVILRVFHELAHDKMFRLYLRIVKRVFHPYHEVIDVKHANNRSQFTEHELHGRIVVRVNVARINHKVWAPSNFFNHFWNVIFGQFVCSHASFPAFRKKIKLLNHCNEQPNVVFWRQVPFFNDGPFIGLIFEDAIRQCQWIHCGVL